MEYVDSLEGKLKKLWDDKHLEGALVSFEICPGSIGLARNFLDITPQNARPEFL